MQCNKEFCKEKQRCYNRNTDIDPCFTIKEPVKNLKKEKKNSQKERRNASSQGKCMLSKQVAAPAKWTIG